MPRRLDIFVDTDHDDDAEARSYIEEILDGDPRVLNVETREVSEVDGYEEDPSQQQ